MRRLLVLLALAACAPRLSPAATGSVTAALQATTQPQTDDPAAPLADLVGLRQVVGAARLVGLGQPGTGARELTRVYHRVVRLLVEETGFTGLALDADATAALALDAYVRGAGLDLDAALQALGDPALASVEMRALLQDLRRHNAAHGGPVRVFGLAPGDPEAAAARVLAYLERVDPAYVPEARSLLATAQQIGTDAVLARLDARRADYLARADAEAWSTARQQAELVAQAHRMAETWEFEAGEFARARNAEWALAQLGPRGKLIVLADNRRIAAEVPGAAPSMGNFLRQWLAAAYRPIAASLLDGSVLVNRDADTPCTERLPPPRTGSLDAALVTGGPLALLDLRGRAQPELARPQVLRTLVGARAEDTVLRPAVAFDAVLGLRDVHASTPLARAAAPCPAAR